MPARRIGRVGGETFTLRTGSAVVQAPVDHLREVYETAIPRLMERTAHD